MARIEWNKSGERYFEAGVDRGVLFPRVGGGVPWNGLVAVNENTSGGEVDSLYFDGQKYLDVIAAEDFSASLEAFGAPDEFNASDGVKVLSPGLYVTQQPRQTFGLCYRTLIGNDLQGPEYGYKLHLVYNCTAAPAPRSHKTMAGATAPGTRTWNIHSVPPPASTFRPTSHIVIDSTKVDPYLMRNLETTLYGRDLLGTTPERIPMLPTVSQIVLILANRISEFIEEPV